MAANCVYSCSHVISYPADDTIINVSLVAGVIFGVIAIFVVAAAVVVVVAFIKLRAHKKTRLGNTLPHNVL